MPYVPLTCGELCIIRAPLLSRTIIYRRSSLVEMSHLIGMEIVCSQPRTQHTYQKKLEPNDLIVFPHRYRRDGTHRRDRTGGAKKEKEILF